MKSKFLFGLVLFFLGVFILFLIGKKGLFNSSSTNLLSGEKQYDDGIRLLSSDLNKAKRKLDVALGLGFYKANAPIGSFYLKKGDVKSAKFFLKKALDSIKIYPNQNQRVIYNELAIVYDKQNDTDSAIFFWEKSAKLGSEDAKKNLNKSRLISR